DLNCGYGHSSIILAAQGLEVFGVDGSPELIASAQAALSGFALHFRPANPLHLPFPDDWFDAALSLTGYGYLPARGARLAALDEIYRVLRGDAPLVLSYYVAPEEGPGSPRKEERQIQAAADSSLPPTTPEGAGGSFVRWLPAQAFREELSQSRFLVQRFVVEKLRYGTGEPVGAALLKKPAGGVQAPRATDEGREEPAEEQ